MRPSGQFAELHRFSEVKGMRATAASDKVRLLDYMVASGGHSKCFQSNRVALESDPKTQKPVQLQFYPTLADLKFLTFARPPQFLPRILRAHVQLPLLGTMLWIARTMACLLSEKGHLGIRFRGT